MNKSLQDILSLTAMKDKEHDMPIKLKLMGPPIKKFLDNIIRNIYLLPILTDPKIIDQTTVYISEQKH